MAEELFERWSSKLTDLVSKMDATSWNRIAKFFTTARSCPNGRWDSFGGLSFFDAIHHRGQLSAYLRPMGSTVPSIYGPSADSKSA